MKKFFFIVMLSVSSVMARAQLTLGSIAPEIALPNSADSMISLSSLKGKVVLIDFWASWCVPCRGENPAVVRLYKKYAAKGFEVFGVSIDVKKEAWIKAIKQDKITYTQVVDNTGWYSKVAEQYFVNEIPASFLLDSTGKIVAINAGGYALERKIKKLLQ
jgi:thiol-disulfide isomerase/thioredoxin